MIAIVTGLLLFLPTHVLAYFGAAEIATKYRGWFAIVFVFSILLIVAYPVEHYYTEWSETRRIRGYLRSLPNGELTVLRRCLLNDGRAIRVITDEGPARSLEKKGILWQSTATAGVTVTFNLTHSAYRILKEPEFLPWSDPDNVGE